MYIVCIALTSPYTRTYTHAHARSWNVYTHRYVVASIFMMLLHTLPVGYNVISLSFCTLANLQALIVSTLESHIPYTPGDIGSDV